MWSASASGLPSDEVAITSRLLRSTNEAITRKLPIRSTTWQQRPGRQPPLPFPRALFSGDSMDPLFHATRRFVLKISGH